MLTLRRPAPTDHLARRIADIAWRGHRPCEGSRWWLVETCRAELDWASAQWRRLDPAAGAEDRRARDRGLQQPHPSEAWRLPHEQQAARLVNAHLHLDVENGRIRELLARLPGQRSAAADAAQSADYRACWRQRTEDCESELRTILARRRRAWRAFLAAASNYRRLRAALLPLDAAA